MNGSVCSGSDNCKRLISNGSLKCNYHQASLDSNDEENDYYDGELSETMKDEIRMQTAGRLSDISNLMRIEASSVIYIGNKL